MNNIIENQYLSLNKVNVAYNEFLIYNIDGKPLFPNSNVSKYDIHPWHVCNYYNLEDEEKKLGIKFPYYINGTENSDFLNSLNKFNSQLFEGFVSNVNNDFIGRTLDDLSNTEENFIYPIILYNNDLIDKYETIELNDKLIYCLKRKQGRIIILQLTEGFIGIKKSDFIWMSNLVKKYNFDSDRLILLTSNMYAEDIFENMIKNNEIDNNFIVYSYSYFQHNLWFLPGGHVLSNIIQDKVNYIFKKFLNLNRTEVKKYYFLCFNRIVKNHRLMIFAELMSNPKFKGKFITSMGSSYNFEHILLEHADSKDFYFKLKRSLGDDYKHSKQRLLDFYYTYDSRQKYIFDVDDLENNKANTFNEDAHSKSFVNIVTESLTDNNTVFFSEKTFKPIAALQPFIMIGNPFSLKMLRKNGYKTFDKWWDESYDDEIDLTKRFEKIIDILEDISTWSLEKCFKVTNEMEEILIHNFNNMISSDKIDKLNNFLKVDNKNNHKCIF